MFKKIIKENYIYLIIIIALITILSIIMRSSLHDKIIIIDKKVISMISNNTSLFLVKFFKILTMFGGFIIPFCILVVLLIVLKNKLLLIIQTFSYGFAGIITYISKLIVARPRPESALIKIPVSYSFPSGHTLTSIIFYTILFYLLTTHFNCKYKRIIIAFGFVFSILIAISRVYLGVHYLSDIIGGFIISIPCLLMCINIIEKNFKEKL